jgi:serine/threonine protein kinase
MVPEVLIGKEVRCANCKQTLVAHGSEPAPPPPPPSVSAPPPPPPSTAASVSCPVCNSALTPETTVCPECGYQLKSSETKIETNIPTNLCPNPSCGVANPPGERLCGRCNTPLPTGIGQIIAGRYRIDRQLATGGFGIVYLGTDTTSNQRVAVKEMIEADDTEAAIRRTFFRREAEILRFLQSAPIVPRLFELIEASKSAYLVMEFIAGQNLLEILEKPGGKPFPVTQVARWGAKICEVLSQMHRQNPPLVHRDLKPDNIMLAPDGSTIRMIDFGTARALGKSAKERSVPRTKVFTEGYAPPEQVIGRPEPRSDLFALAGTLYHLVTGKAPEGFFTSREIAARLRDSNSSLPVEEQWFYEILATNLAEDPADRYMSADDLRRDLELQRVTRERECRKCRTPNDAREPFCKSCAEALAPEGALCKKCQHMNLLGCRFCIQCGSRVG